MKKTVLIVLGVILAVVLGFGLLVFIGYKGIHNRPPTDAEKSMMISLDVLAPYGYSDYPRNPGESWNAKVNIDGSMELEYEYSTGESDTNFLYITSDVNLESTTKDAKQSFLLAVEAYKLGLKIGGASAEKRPELFTLGDEHYSALILVDEQPFGNMVVVRNDRIIHSLIIMGLYFEEQDDLESLFFQALENADPAKFGSE